MAVGRPIVGAIRRALIPPEPIPQIDWVQIESGRASSCWIQLPVPSKLADKIRFNEYEPETLAILEHLVSPTDVCYDVGGHYGAFTIHLAKLAHLGSVHTLEPIDHLAKSISNSCERSGLTNVTVHQLALSNTNGNVAMQAAGTGGDDSMGYIQQFGGVQTPRSQVQYGTFQTVVVPSVSLDECGLPPPQFIKMDIEGAELAALASGKHLLNQYKPRLLLEMHGVERSLACAHLLKRLNYTGWQIAPQTLAPQILWLHQDDSQGRTVLKSLQSDHCFELTGSE